MPCNSVKGLLDEWCKSKDVTCGHVPTVTKEEPASITIEARKIILAPLWEDDSAWLPGMRIKDVKFSYSKRTGKTTTVMLFADGTKTMATPMDGDEFSPEEGINQCILKKLFGNRSKMKKQYKKWITEGMRSVWSEING